MELVFYGNGASNFGDDLNLIVWKRVLPQWVFEVEDVALLGIGTVFTDQWTGSSKIKGKRVFVIGSGAGYWPLPRDRASWTVLALRGPLSAALINRPELASTDAAALMALDPLIKVKKADKILLIPHHESIPGSYWQQVAEEAGITFVDPRWPPEIVLEHFAQAKLVLAEAMHGAIVADTLRIPWLPWAGSPHLLPFKWVDWTMSLNLQYKPTLLPATSTWGKWRHHIASMKFRHQGIKSPLETIALTEPSAYVDDFRARYGQVTPPKQRSNKNLHNFARNSAITLSKFFGSQDIKSTVAAINHLVKEPPYLSEDNILKERVEKLQGAIEEFTRLLR
jgi:succinoglycan biosynthesis protein ExoV